MSLRFILKSGYLLICQILLFFVSGAQQLPKVIPPSPTVASLIRFSETPVGHYTGTANVSIPIYNIQSGDISLPVSLSYNTSGIRVADEASQVGLGWNLIAGGVISRTILGGDDFSTNPTGYHSSNGVATDIVNGFPNFGVYPNCQLQLSSFPYNTSQFVSSNYDYQPDLYSFSLPGKNGKFILKRNKEVILHGLEKIKIVPIDNDASGWDITLENGMVYQFREYETYTDNLTSSAGPPGTYKIAWYLTKIVSPNGSTIDFTYTTVNNVYVKPIGSISEFQNPNLFFEILTGCSNNQTNTYSLPNSLESAPGKDYKKIYLSKITFNSGELRFVYESDRLDLLNDVRLSKVQLFRSAFNPTSLIFYKEWEFQHGYFSGTGDQDVTLGTIDQRTKRLKLISIKEKDAVGTSLSPYTFSYINEDVAGAASYPSKTSFARDHWGYFNGKISNTSLIPTFSVVTGAQSLVDYHLGSMGDQRNPNHDFSSLFLLKSVTYPTGGKTEFEYEGNDFDFSNSIKNDKSYNQSFAAPVSQQLSRLYNGNIVGVQPTVQDMPNKILDLTNLFLFRSQSTSPITISAFFRYKNNQSVCRPVSFASSVSFSLVSESGQEILIPVDPINYSVTDNLICASSAGSFVGFTITQNVSISPGKYYVKLIINSGTTWLGDVAVNVYYNANVDGLNLINGGQTLAGAAWGGGVRVKRIRDFDNIASTIPRIRKYLYTDIDAGNNNIISSGIRMAAPNYSYFEDGEDICVSGNSYHIKYYRLCRVSDSNTPLNGAGDIFSVGYSKVTELNGENGEFGKTEYYFENKSDNIFSFDKTGIIQGASYKYPIKPPAFSSIPNYGNGNLTRQILYAKRGDIFERIKESVYNYQNYFSGFHLWYGIERRSANMPAYFQNCPFDVVTYPAIILKRIQLESEVTTEYDMSNPNRSISKKISNLYDHSTHLQLIQKIESIGINREKVVSYTYPLDYSDQNAGSVVTDMKNGKHIHNAIVTQKEFIQTGTTIQMIGGLINRFHYFNGKIAANEIASLDLIQPVVPASISDYIPAQASTYPSSYSVKAVFESYDNLLNPIQFRKKDDYINAIIWDYNSSWPIAEVKNAPNSEVAYTSFEANGTGNWNIPSTSRVSGGITGGWSYNLTNGALSKGTLVSGKSYIISYWSKTGAPFSLLGGTVQISRTGRSFNGWTFFEMEVITTSTSLSVSGNGQIDELRLYPKGALIQTFTYSPLIGISSMCDQSNRINYYEYDSFGRLLLIKDLEGNIIKTFEYKHKQ